LLFAGSLCRRAIFLSTNKLSPPADASSLRNNRKPPQPHQMRGAQASRPSGPPPAATYKRPTGGAVRCRTGRFWPAQAAPFSHYKFVRILLGGLTIDIHVSASLAKNKAASAALISVVLRFSRGSNQATSGVSIDRLTARITAGGFALTSATVFACAGVCWRGKRLTRDRVGGQQASVGGGDRGGGNSLPPARGRSGGAFLGGSLQRRFHASEFARRPIC
jgi:hypothetical protein